MFNPTFNQVFNHWLGVDTGGTFTDFVYFDGVSVRIHKVLSTPNAPELAILQGINEMGVCIEGLQIVHGSTVATNAVLENKGVNTLYITNRGFADVLSIGRQARKELYNLMPKPKPALIPSSHCLEINTRLSAQGELIQPLEQVNIDALLQKIQHIKPRAIAINLLFSFLDDRQEKTIKKAIKEMAENYFVCCSSEVLPEYKEYERGMATALNAYIGPLMQRYLDRLLMSLDETEDSSSSQRFALSVLQSNGGTIGATEAGEKAVNLLLSGPAGGLKGVQYVAGLSGESKLLSFDMGGTSTDVALIDEKIQLSSEGFIGDYPVAVPMVDMHTIGAGGGSIAYVDAGGLLNVGPESAGANPGPACYGLSGELPTVTDANLILGRLSSDGFLDKGMTLDLSAAKESMSDIAKQLNMSIYTAASGVIQIANEHMVRALRAISVQKGHDLAVYSLACFGGAGGLHVCALADALHMRRAIVPVFAGVLSALGMLVSAPSRELSVSCIETLINSDEQKINLQFAALEKQARHGMRHERVSKFEMRRSVDCRYQGQSFSLNIEWAYDGPNNETGDGPGDGPNDGMGDNLGSLEKTFHRLHKSTYGHDLDMPVELVNLRLSAKGEVPPFSLPLIEKNKEYKNYGYVDCYGFDEPVKIVQREELSPSVKITGPALILEKGSTTLIEPGWECVVDAWGNLLLQC